MNNASAQHQITSKYICEMIFELKIVIILVVREGFNGMSEILSKNIIPGKA